MGIGISFPTPKQVSAASYGRFPDRMPARPDPLRFWSDHMPGAHFVLLHIRQEAKDHPKLARFVKLFVPTK